MSDAVPIKHEVLTVAEAAAQLGIHPNTLRAYCAAGEIAFIRLPSGHRRFTQASVDDFKARHSSWGVALSPDEVEIEP